MEIKKLKYTKICAICNKEFQSNYSNAKYCTDECRSAKIVNCAHCGKEFDYNQKKSSFCSMECTREVLLKICQHCGKEFLSGISTEKYCNWKCKDRSEGKYTIICATCGKEFRTNYQNSKYCSEDCKPSYKHICCCCGKVRFTKKQIASYYCSDKCKTSSTNYLYMCTNDKGEVIFIGDKKNLGKTMGINYRPKENTLFKDVNEIFRHKCIGTADRLLKEVYLIRKYKPKYGNSINTKEKHKLIEELEVSDWKLIYKSEEI